MRIIPSGGRSCSRDAGKFPDGAHAAERVDQCGDKALTRDQKLTVLVQQGRYFDFAEFAARKPALRSSATKEGRFCSNRDAPAVIKKADARSAFCNNRVTLQPPG